MRKSGVLLPVTSLPSKYGIGCFSKSAYEFIDWLKDAGQSFWQILPLCPTSFGDSPYQSFSTFAINPYMISLNDLITENLLTKEDCDMTDFGDDERYIDYKKQYEKRFPLLKKAYKNFDASNDENYKKFVDENSFWLPDYSLFMALKYHFNQKVWNKWDYDILIREKDAVERYIQKLYEEINFWNFLQYKAYSMWHKLKEYANKNGISIIGDIPIYVSFDSCDVWKNPNIFQLDENFNPTFVAGCPPDGFSKKGQLWGNPLYNWDELQKTDYKWWIQRIKKSFEMYDVLRIDHFRGFDEYYSIPYLKEDATEGTWQKANGFKLFEKVKKELGENKIIAEDLGFITSSVKKLLKDCGFPGMKILQFAFDKRDTGSSNDYLPHNYPENCVAYTGTHDNQTLFSWFNTIDDDEKKAVRDYLCDYFTPDEKLNYPLISLIMESNAHLCIIPMQDLLCKDDNARINIPSTLGNNWRWRLKKGELSRDLKEKLYNMTKIYERL